MKGLTIKEPWASLIINGYKKYEFRSFKTNYRGKILIHAGLNLESDNALKFKDYNLNYGFYINEAYKILYGNGKTGKGERHGINNNSNNLFGW